MNLSDKLLNINVIWLHRQMLSKAGVNKMHFVLILLGVEWYNVFTEYLFSSHYFIRNKY
jgi:hypothetical protein